MGENNIRLTKSKFITGLRCNKKLYLECYKPHLAMPLSETEQTRINESIYIGNIARDIYKNGCLIHTYNNLEALERTKEALLSSEVNTIYEAAFVYDDIFIRADILLKNDDGQIDLIEVKSSNKVKKDHLYDLGIQYFVIENSGLKIRKASILHINSQFKKTDDNYNLEELFKIEDLTEQVIEIQNDVISNIASINRILEYKKSPSVSLGKHCKKPFFCQFFNYCVKGLKHPVIELPRVSDNILQSLKELGIKDISKIPPDFNGLTEIQQRVRDAVVDGEAFFDPLIREELKKFVFPVHFLDFETFNPALPLFNNTIPYQMIPFQWSDHILYRDGKVDHKEFLHNDLTEPHIAFAQTLLNVLKDKGTIVVYSNFEATRIKELSEILPHLADQFNNVLIRIIDIQELIKKYCYYSEFHGSYSLKKVLPSLVADLNYDDLEIANGAVAANALKKIIFEKISFEEKERLVNNLIEYCKRDTEAMLKLYKYFFEN